MTKYRKDHENMHVLNRENLIDATDGDTQMEAMLYQSFFKTSSDYMQQVEANPEGTEERAKALHSLKGVALNMGAEALGELCRKAESESVETAEIEDLYKKTCAEMQQVIDSAE